MRRIYGAIIMKSIPEWNTFENVGSYYISEYTMVDGCDKTRTLPSCVIMQPHRTTFESQVCDNPKQIFTEWSIGMQIMNSSGDYVTGLNHSIGIRVTSTVDTPISTIIDNIIELLAASRLNGALNLGSISIDARATS